jgi:thiosulfate/3-mercaptopyruvate sulfurtransferase
MPANGFNNSSSSSGSTQDQTADDKTVSAQTATTKTVPKSSSSADDGQASLLRSNSFQKMLAPISNTSDYDVILDISNGTKEHIPEAVHIDYLDFMTDNNTLKSASDLAELLGNAGISNRDRVLIYGECQPCGGGPSAATFAYYVLKYLGHDDVKVLDGGIRDWAASNQTLVSTIATRPNATYAVNIRPEILATYEQVKNGQVQLVDARTFQEFGSSNIPGSLNIPYDSVLSGGRIKDEAALKKLFSGLKKDRTVVVYTNTGVKASMIWFALELMGYDARLYTWQDWIKNRPI